VRIEMGAINHPGTLVSSVCVCVLAIIVLMVVMVVMLMVVSRRGVRMCIEMGAINHPGTAVSRNTIAEIVCVCVCVCVCADNHDAHGGASRRGARKCASKWARPTTRGVGAQDLINRPPITMNEQGLL